MLKINKGIRLPLIFFVFLSITYITVKGQAEFLPINHNLQLKLGKRIYFDTAHKVHTSMQRRLEIYIPFLIIIKLNLKLAC